MNRRMLLLLALVIPLVVLTSWLSRQSEAPTGAGGDAEQLPDYFLHGLDSTVTDSKGRTSHRLVAASLTHYPDDTTELEQPDITVFGTRQTTWQASARQGRVEGKQQQIFLRGEVHLIQRGDEQLDLLTDWLRINTDRHYAETEAKVVLEAPAGRVQGIGMKAYGDEQRLLLLSTVRGQYATD